MHYYKFNIADYRKDTQHLTVIEHYIYRELIDWYYLDEKLIPTETQSVIRRLRLVSENEPELKNVLNDFFIETRKGWKHARIDIELSKYHDKANINKANGSKGGRPKKTQSVNSANRNESEQNPNHKPLTINHKPITNKEKSKHLCDSSDEKSPRNVCPVSKIVMLYHELLPELPRMEKVTAARAAQIKQRWREDLKELDHWKNFFNFIRESNFLMGKEPPTPPRTKPFIATLHWITKAENFAKIYEDAYHG